MDNQRRTSRASDTRPQFRNPHRPGQAKRIFKHTLSWPKCPDPDWKNGRVLLIDYRNDSTTSGTNSSRQARTIAREFGDLASLTRFYARDAANRAGSRADKKPALRVVHVQNASWANQFLLHKYHITGADDVVGTDFAKWARFEEPEWRAGKPLLKGKSFRAQLDPWRGITRTAFGLDYLTNYDAPSAEREAALEEIDRPLKMMELNRYNDLDVPVYGFDVFVQRLSVYIQYCENESSIEPEKLETPLVELEYSNHYRRWKGSPEAYRQRLPSLKSLDNGNAILIFDHSQSGSVNDTIVGARQQMESRWRRLTFFLKKEVFKSDTELAIELMDYVLTDIFKALSVGWDEIMNLFEVHVSIFENKIYSNPSDESRAPELWANSALWLKVERLMLIHCDIVKEMIGHLHNLVQSDDDENVSSRQWLGNTPDEYDRFADLVQADLVKPIANLSDLMYKSIGIRDARYGLQLNASMWRLSWITFVFLPLTFMVSFFGMNVDTFSNAPSIKYYFAAAVPLMCLIFVSYWVLKGGLESRHHVPYQRGIYESLFHDWALAYPLLWSRDGPRRHVQPVGFGNTLKWRLLSSWFQPRKTIRRPREIDGDDDSGASLSIWAKLKRSLARRWLPEIEARPDIVGTGLPGDPGYVDEEGGAVQSMVKYSTPIVVAQAEPSNHPLVHAHEEALGLPGRSPSRSRSRSQTKSQEREDHSPGTSDIMVEVRSPSEEDDSGDEDTSAHDGNAVEIELAQDVESQKQPPEQAGSYQKPKHLQEDDES